MTLKDKIVSDTLFATVIKIGEKARGILFIPLITLYLGANAYGVYAQLIVVTRLLAGTFELGLHSAVIRYFQSYDYVSERRELYVDVLGFILVLSTLVAGGMFVFAERISQLTLNDATYADVYRLGALLIPINSALIIAENYYRAKRRIKSYSLLNGLKTYLSMVAVGYVVLFQSGTLTDLVLYLVLTELSFFLLIQGDVFRHLGVQFPRFRTIPKSLRYSLPVMAGQISGNFLTRADRLLLGYFIGPFAVGAYTVAYKFANQILLFSRPLSNSFFPEFSNLWENNKREDARSYLHAGTRYFLTLAVPSVVGFTLVGERLIALISTSEVASEGGLALPIIAIGVSFWGLTHLYSCLYYAAELTKPVSYIRIIGAGVNILLNVLLIPIFGLVGAAVTTAVSYFCIFTVMWWYSRNMLGMDNRRYRIHKIGFASIGMYSVVSTSGFDGLLIVIPLAVVCYFLVLFLIGGLTRSEIESLVRPIRSVWAS
ncbi:MULTISPECIES: flippase [Salinibaculum]|uniref:flippase n=1 Tax=Salinibaculum TaxID=2732368 RepID=UPI0030D36871